MDQSRPFGPASFSHRQHVAFWMLAVLMLMPESALAEDRVLNSETGEIKIETVAADLDRPWGLAFLPDGRMLVTEKRGRLRIVSKDGTKSEPLAGVPKVDAGGQGGLMDVVLDPKFDENQLIYLSYAESGEGGNGTAVARGKLGESGLDDVQVIFRQHPKVKGDLHYGSRLAFSPDGKLFITLGDRFKFDPAQDLGSHIGKVVRINSDGSVPEDNPFVTQTDALPEIWSYGHRNAQGAAIHPETGKLWENEFGPLGGDELNIPEAGKNYGWPMVSWGKNYNGIDIPDPPTHPEFADAIYHWTPVISPSGMTFYTGDAIPAWKGDLLIGGLSYQALVRLTLDGEKVSAEERLPLGGRIRDVKQGPDGAVYAIDESNDQILRLTLVK